MWSRKPSISFGLLVICVAFQGQYCECEFWEPAKTSRSWRFLSLWQGPLRRGCPGSPSLWGIPLARASQGNTIPSYYIACPWGLHKVEDKWERKDLVLHAVWKEFKGRRGSSVFLLFSVSIICCHHELFYFHRLILGSASGTGGCASDWHPRATWPRLRCPITIWGIWLRILSKMG